MMGEAGRQFLAFLNLFTIPPAEVRKFTFRIESICTAGWQLVTLTLNKKSTKTKLNFQVKARVQG